MKRHLTEQELIEYRFKLASDAQMGEIGGHLGECGQCRGELGRLARKFAALDLLHEEIKASEDLISQVVEQAGQPRRIRLAAYRKLPAWAGAAAAVLVVGLLLVVSNLPKSDLYKEPVARGPGIAGIDEKETLAPYKFAAEGVGGFGMRPTADLAEPGISEQAPFAPASAIELVTLPRRDNVQLTIYNSADLTLVRERRNLTLKRGWNWLQFMWANTLIDPTSLSLEPLEKGDEIDIQQLVFPARLRELGRWLIRSEVSGQVPFEITYFTSGLSWRAFYMGTLGRDEKTMQMKGYVVVGNNSGEDYEDAQTRLIVGQVHLLDQIAELAARQYAYGRPGAEVVMLEEALDAGGIHLANGLFAPGVVELKQAVELLDRKEIKKEGLSEYFLYTIEGTETIPHQWGKRLLSFEAEDIKVDSLYKYDEERWGDQTIRFVKFANDKDHNLGETPIPDGDVRIYSQADDIGHLSYVGGTSVKYIPVSEEVELDLGPARLVKVEPVLMSFKTDNYMFDTKKEIAGWDEIRSWDMKLTNTRELPVEIEITRGFGTAYWTLRMDAKDVDYKKHDATHARFELKLGPRTKRTLGYTVTTYHGVREEAMSK
jgi:hypothetical protein